MIRSTQFWKRASIWGAGAAIVVAGTGVASASPANPSSIPDAADDEVHVCYNVGASKNTAGGAFLSIFDNKINKKKCGKGKKELVLNQEGPKGDKGSKGDKGAKGTTGATGPQGLQGNVGPQGLQGPSAIPVSMFVLAGLGGPTQNFPNRAYYPEGQSILSSSTIGLATAAFDITLSDLEIEVGGNATQAPRTYWLSSATGSIPCLVPATQTHCDGVGTLPVPADGTYWFTTGQTTPIPLGPGSDLPGGSRISYVIAPTLAP